MTLVIGQLWCAESQTDLALFVEAISAASQISLGVIKDLTGRGFEPQWGLEDGNV